MSHLSNVWFKVTDLQVVSGHGCRVTTASGEEYLDFAAGIAVNSTGHSHPHVVEAIATQAARFIHAQANVFTHDLLEPLASRLAGFAAGMAPDVVYEETGTQRRVDGVDAYVQLCQGWKQAFPDARGEIRNVVASGNTGVQERA